MAHPGSSRDRVFEAIRSAFAPVSIEDLTSLLELHANTVRSHVNALEETGLVDREDRRSGSKGRPQAVYRATTQGARSGRRNYEVLAEVLVEDLVASAPDPVAAARTAGRGWGDRLRPGNRAQALALLDDMGFSPEPHPSSRPRELRLHNCPFLELVENHQQVVCALHGGMVEALFSTPAADAALLPFVTPTTCVVQLPQRSGSR